MSCKCKKICKNCKHYVPEVDAGVYTGILGINAKCKIVETKITDCVTGKETTTFGDPYKLNEDGCCKKWEATIEYTMSQKDNKLIKDLKRALEDEMDTNPSSVFRRSVLETLLRDVIGVFEGRESDLIESMGDMHDGYGGGSPYGIIVATKSLYTRSKNNRREKSVSKKPQLKAAPKGFWASLFGE